RFFSGSSLMFSPCSQRFAFGADYNYWVYSLRPKGTVTRLRPSAPRTNETHPKVAFSPNGEFVAIKHDRFGFSVCKASDGIEASKFTYTDDECAGHSEVCLRWSSNGKQLACAAYGMWGWEEPDLRAVASLWDVETRSRLRFVRVQAPLAHIRELVGEEAWKKADLRERTNLLYPRDCDAMVYSPDGRTLATVGKPPKQVLLWETETGDLRRETQLRASALAFLPDGRLLAAGLDGKVQVWDWRTPGCGSPSQASPEQLWSDLASSDSRRAEEALVALASREADALQVIRRQVLDRWISPTGIRRLLASLDDTSAAVREKAQRRLQDAVGAVRREYAALAASCSAEARRRMARVQQTQHSQRLRLGRAIECLEVLGTEPARRLLEKLKDRELDDDEHLNAAAALARSGH
ncbi:MAG: hypothetical protein K2W96_10115, partial [Gemmataceae bacterium]|nr:hypothetical protein [Gemmataceae bacterium]